MNTRSKKTAPLRRRADKRQPPKAGVNAKADSRRLEIVASACQAIRKLGWRRAGMRQIAETAKISAGSLYYYFKDKEELLFFCQDLTLDALLEMVQAARVLPRVDTQLNYLIQGHLKLLLDPRLAGPVHLEFDELPPALYQKLVRKRDRYERAVREIIEQGQVRGEIRAGDPKLQAFGLLGALNWTARWYNHQGPIPVSQVAEVFSEQLLGGLLDS